MHRNGAGRTRSVVKERCLLSVIGFAKNYLMTFKVDFDDAVVARSRRQSRPSPDRYSDRQALRIAMLLWQWALWAASYRVRARVEQCGETRTHGGTGLISTRDSQSRQLDVRLAKGRHALAKLLACLEPVTRTSSLRARRVPPSKDHSTLDRTRLIGSRSRAGLLGPSRMPIPGMVACCSSRRR